MRQLQNTITSPIHRRYTDKKSGETKTEPQQPRAECRGKRWKQQTRRQLHKPTECVADIRCEGRCDGSQRLDRILAGLQDAAAENAPIEHSQANDAVKCDEQIERNAS